MPPDSLLPTCIIGEADPFLARLLQRFAETRGLRIYRAQTGEDVLSRAGSEQPAVILLDPELPGRVRGWEAVRELHTSPETRSIPVVLCSWLAAAEAQALSGRPLPHLRKPDLHYEDFTTALELAGVKLD